MRLELVILLVVPMSTLVFECPTDSTGTLIRAPLLPLVDADARAQPTASRARLGRGRGSATSTLAAPQRLAAAACRRTSTMKWSTESLAELKPRYVGGGSSSTSHSLAGCPPTSPSPRGPSSWRPCAAPPPTGPRLPAHVRWGNDVLCRPGTSTTSARSDPAIATRSRCLRRRRLPRGRPRGRCTARRPPPQRPSACQPPRAASLVRPIRWAAAALLLTATECTTGTSALGLCAARWNTTLGPSAMARIRARACTARRQPPLLPLAGRRRSPATAPPTRVNPALFRSLFRQRWE